MSLEQAMAELTAALNANTAALKGAPAAGKPTPTAAAGKPAPAANKPAPTAAPANGAADPAKLTKAREELKKVLDAKGADEVRAILTEVGAAKLSDVAADKVDDLFAAINKRLAPAEGAGATMFD